MSHHRVSGRGPIRLRRTFGWAFVIGAVATVPVIALMLLAPIPEEILWPLLPGPLLLQPFSLAMADWPGAISVGLGLLLNGVVYGLVATGVAGVLNLGCR